MVCGIVGAVVALVPFLGVVAVVIGAAALGLGIFGLRTYRREPAAGRRGMAVAGIVLGPIAIVLGVIGIVLVNNFFDRIGEGLGTFGDELQQELEREQRREDRSDRSDREEREEREERNRGR